MDLFIGMERHKPLNLKVCATIQLSICAVTALLCLPTYVQPRGSEETPENHLPTPTP